MIFIILSRAGNDRYIRYSIIKGIDTILNQSFYLCLSKSKSRLITRECDYIRRKCDGNAIKVIINFNASFQLEF